MALRRIGNDRTYNVDTRYQSQAWNDGDNPQFYVPQAQGVNTKEKARLLRPSYGYTAEYDTKFRMFSYGDGYYSITPVGLNPTTVSFTLNYEGIKEGDDLEDFVGFFEATRGESFTFLPPEPFCKYNNFRCDGYSTNYGQNDNALSVTLIGTSQSALNINKTSQESYGISPPTEASTMYLGEASEFTGNYKKAESEPLDYENYQLTGYNDRITRLNNGANTNLIATTSDSYEFFEMRLRGWQKNVFYPKDSVVSSMLYDSQNPIAGGFEKYFYAKEDHVSVAGSNGLPSALHVEQYWTDQFHWQPTAGSSNVGQTRVMMSEFGEGRTEVMSDGRNANPLVFSFQFNNRSDIESYAILHYLESRRGYIRFPVSKETIPAPYKSNLAIQPRYFMCGKWTYSKNYLDNNSISATFIEDPLGIDLAGQSYDNQYTAQP